MKKKKQNNKGKRTDKEEKETHRKRKQANIQICTINQPHMMQQRKTGQQIYTQRQLQQVT